MDRNFLQEALSVIGGLGQREYAKSSYEDWKKANPAPTPESIASLVATMANNQFAAPYLTAANTQYQSAQAKEKERATAESKRMDDALAAIRAAQSAGYQINEDAMPGVIGAIAEGRAPRMTTGDKTLSVPQPPGFSGLTDMPLPVNVPGKSILEKKPGSSKLTHIKPGDDGWLYGLNAEGEYIQVPGSEGLAAKAAKYYGIGYKGNELWGINQTTGKYEPISGSEGVKKYDPAKPSTSSGSAGGLTRPQKARVDQEKDNLLTIEEEKFRLRRELSLTKKTVIDTRPGSPNYGREIPNPDYIKLQEELRDLEMMGRRSEAFIRSWEGGTSDTSGTSSTGGAGKSSGKSSGTSKRSSKSNRGGGF